MIQYVLAELVLARLMPTSPRGWAGATGELCCGDLVSEELEPKWGTLSALFVLILPQVFYASCPSLPEARISPAPNTAYLGFRTMFLWTSLLLVLQPAFLSCRFYFSHVFSCALFVQLYHISPFALACLYIIYVLNLTKCFCAAAGCASCTVMMIKKIFICHCKLCRLYPEPFCLGGRQASCLRETAASALTVVSQDKRKYIYIYISLKCNL